MPLAKPNSMTLSESLETARRDLLDLGLRNPLLNYRTMRAKGVEVVDEIPPEIFRLLVREEKSLTFLPTDNADEEQNGNVPDVHLAQPTGDRRPRGRPLDLRLRTAHPSTQLQGRLLATYHAARTSVEEQGVNTLYLAMGMLCWREEGHSDKVLRAPLILIPVELGRSSARERFHLKFTGEDLGGNVSLAEKLKQDFGIKTLPELPDPDDLDVDEYLGKVARTVVSRPGWAVDKHAVALGFFSFAKLLMYRDLDPKTWPTPSAILEHGVLRSLLGEEGFGAGVSNYTEDRLLDDQLRNRDFVQVVDSDSSQTLATLDSLDGHTMVIQGPPGTGKSQTIVNLIAGALAGGKRILFVAEKMAALDVVKRRLDRVGLGAACLELHSNRTNKKSIIEELRSTALGRRHESLRPSCEISLLSDNRERLNEYCKAVNEPIGKSGESPCVTYGNLLGAQTALKGVELPNVQLGSAELWTADVIARRKQIVAQMQDRVLRTGIPIQHPFWGSDLRVVLPTDSDRFRGECLKAESACSSYEDAANSLANLVVAEAPSTGRDVDQLLETTKHIIRAPAMQGVNLDPAVWAECESQIRLTLVAGLRYRDLHGRFDAVVRAEAWNADVAAIRIDIASLGPRWWRVFSGRWRRAMKALAQFCLTAPPVGVASQLAMLDAIAQASVCAQDVNRLPASVASLFGDSWNGVDSDWDLLEAQFNWVIAACTGVSDGTLAAWCVDPKRVNAFTNNAISEVRRLDSARLSYQSALRGWREALDVDEGRYQEGPLSAQPFGVLRRRWLLQAERIHDLHSLVAFNRIFDECANDGLGSIAHVAACWEHAATKLSALYERARSISLLERAFLERKALAGFDGVRHSNAVSEFRRLDLLQLELNRALLADKHAQALPAGGGAGEVGILWREFEKRARFLTIRNLVARAGHAIQSIKPVFMMSPLSIANYLPPGALSFDLIIFDEASQVRPVDALGAIVRGQQTVVVGDSRQLPPTSFFDSLVGSQDDGPDEDESATSDIESVLGLFCSRGAHQRMLRWHYRSRHESLIVVSNHLFYDDRLVVFPSPDRSGQEIGLVYRHLEGAFYERSRTRTNPVEAKEVAAAVMTHARAQLHRPRELWETLGVAAFSMTQMDAILNQLEILRRQDPSCEDFFSYPPYEPFFVKNLENLQGDERDVILISIGYGPTAEGYLAMSFGPLNRNGGERRLNVLISRARRRCEVFTALTADDIDLSRTNSGGVSALKTFLSYAQSGQIEVPKQTGREPDSEFEEQVRRQLAALGYEVHAQVGSAGFFLDLAVVDTANPGRYLLGIECDGARYHSALSARDRDRLRQAVLEGLGWSIYRIWSTDWFRNPDQELRKLLQAIETAATTAPPSPRPPETYSKTGPPSAPPTSSAEQPHTEIPRVASYQCAVIDVRLNGVEMHQMGNSTLAKLLAQVVDVESPVHWMEAARRVVSGAGIQRLGSRIQQAFAHAVRHGADRRLFVQRGDFLWASGRDSPAVRDRSPLPTASRKFDLVAPEEIQQAIVIVVQTSYGIAQADLPAAVCRLFGFARVTTEMAASIEPHCEALLRCGSLIRQGVNLVLGQEGVRGS